MPWMWGDNPTAFLGEGLVVVLSGAVDMLDSGNALFPECLRAELHGARACGYAISKSTTDCTLREFHGGSWTTYNIDRWD